MRTCLPGHPWILALACAAACGSPRTSDVATPSRGASQLVDPNAELARQAGSVVDAFSNFSPVLMRDGRIVFASNRDGSAQLYTADARDPSSVATKLLEWPQPIWGATVAADGSLVFAADRGGDEQPLLYRIGVDGRAVELTNGEKRARDGEVVAALRPDVIYYSARRPEATAWAIYEARLDAGAPPKALYRDDHNGYLVDVRRDGAVALIQHFRAWADRRLITVDLASGKTTPLYPQRGVAAIYAAAFAPDGRVLVGTDGGAEQALVLALDAHGRELARYVVGEPATARIDAIRVAPNGKLVALALDAGNRSELELLDGSSLQRRCRIELPLGSGSLGEFSHDGRHVTATWSTPTAPNDIYAIDTASCTVSPLRREARPSLGKLAAVESRIVEIDAFDGTKLPTNVHVPAHVAQRRFPVIVRYHGGPAGSSTMGWNRLARLFTSQGYAWVEPNVRGSGGFGRAFEQADNGRKRFDAFRDIETTARWVAAQPWADPERMIILGESYGGYAVLMSMIQHAPLWRAGVDLFGLADLETFMATTTGRVRENYLVELGDPAADADYLRSISPLAHVDRIVDPLFVYAGANDPRVPRAQSDAIVAALRKRGIPTDYLVAANEGHSMEQRTTIVELYVRLTRFLEQHTK